MKPQCISVPDAAKVLGVSRSKAFALVADGRLPVIKIDRRTLVPVAGIETLVDQLLQVGRSTSD